MDITSPESSPRVHFTIEALIHRQVFTPRLSTSSVEAMHNLDTSPANPHIASPGDLLSNIPGILGFYPTDSVVFLGLEETESGSRGGEEEPSGTGVSLGPLIRVDIADIRNAYGEVSTLLNTAQHVCVFAFLISHRPHSEIAAISELLYELGDGEGLLDIDAAWWVEEIYAGEVYELLFGPTGSDGSGPLKHWTRGKIPAITASQSMRHCVDNDVIPELSRGDMMKRFSRSNPNLGKQEAAAMAQIGRQAGLELRNNRCILGTKSALSVADVVTDVPRLLSEVESLDQVLGDRDALGAVAVWLSTTWVRDLVVADLLDNPQAAQNLLMAAAHTFAGSIRSNALALYAAVGLTTDCIVYAGWALHVLREEDPHHSLGNLIFSVYRAGKFELISSSMARGCALAREAALGEESSERAA